MARTLTIAKRELMSLFYSPVGYVVMGLYALVSAMVFFLTFDSGEPATLRPTLSFIVWTLIFLAPAISMRLISEEFRSGAIESLMTAPVSDVQVVCGKWLGAMAFYGLVVLLAVGVLVGILFANARPDIGPIIAQLIGLALVGGLYLSIGVAASATTSSQVIAFLLTVFVISLLTFGMLQLASVSFFPPWLQQVFFYMKVDTHFEEFNKGVIDTGAIMYFVSTAAMFLFMAVKLLESRRWR